MLGSILISAKKWLILHKIINFGKQYWKAFNYIETIAIQIADKFVLTRLKWNYLQTIHF